MRCDIRSTCGHVIGVIFWGVIVGRNVVEGV